MGETWSESEPIDSPEESDYLVLLNHIDQVIDGYAIMNILLERRTNANLNVQGGHFTVDYSDIEGNINFVTLGFFDESWLGERDVNVWFQSNEFPVEQKIEVGFTKTDNVSSTGSGAIGQLILAFDANISKKGNTDYQFKVHTIGVHQNNGSYIPVQDQLLQVNLNSPCQPNWTITEDTPLLEPLKRWNTMRIVCG